MTTTEREANWQKHVVIALWLLLGFLIAVSAGLIWAGANGLFESSEDHTIPSWPVGWP